MLTRSFGQFSAIFSLLCLAENSVFEKFPLEFFFMCNRIGENNIFYENKNCDYNSFCFTLLNKVKFCLVFDACVKTSWVMGFQSFWISKHASVLFLVSGPWQEFLIDSIKFKYEWNWFFFHFKPIDRSNSKQMH